MIKCANPWDINPPSSKKTLFNFHCVPQGVSYHKQNFLVTFKHITELLKSVLFMGLIVYYVPGRWGAGVVLKRVSVVF